jgi:hypothetical protein
MAGFNVEAALGLVDHIQDGDLNELYTMRTVVVGGNTPYVSSVTSGSLPPGLGIDSPTGVLSGTPTAAGEFSFTISATDADAVQVTKAYTMIIAGGEPIATATSTPDTGTETATATATASPTVSATPLISATATASPASTATASPASTATASLTSTATALPTASATATVPACAGDCNGDGSVLINELIGGVSIALDNAALDTCPSFDRDGNGAVSIDELITAVNNAQNGC